jgi:hypothetical protein
MPPQYLKAAIPNPMDSKQDVAQSPDLRIDEDFRGLQGVPAKDEMLEQSTGSHRVDEKIEEKGTGANASGVSQRYESSNNSEPQQDTTPREQGLDGNNEERGVPHNVSNEDLASSGKHTRSPTYRKQQKKAPSTRSR